MNRRIFLRSCAASGLAGLTTMRRVMARDEESRFPKPPPLPFRDEKSDLKITKIRAVQLVPTDAGEVVPTGVEERVLEVGARRELSDRELECLEHALDAEYRASGVRVARGLVLSGDQFMKPAQLEDL